MKRLFLTLLFAIPLMGQSPVTVTGLITDAGNNVATSGYVQFDVIPKSSSIHYFIAGFGTISQTTQCGISASGVVLNLTLSSACTVWGNDSINPGNTQYKVTFAPNGNITNVISGECLTGSTYSLNNPVFCPIVQITPQQVIIRSNPFQVNILPSATNTFNIGSPLNQYAAVYANQFVANGVTLTSPGFTLGTNNTWTGINTFSNTVNLNNGGSIGGTWTGSPIFSGSPNFSNTPTFTRATGNSPFTVTSTTLVANLNAALLGGLSPPGSVILGLTDTQSPTNKTFDISLNTLRSSANIAGHYLRNNGTQYVDNTLQSADLPATTSNCTSNTFAQGLSSGGTPICASPVNPTTLNKQDVTSTLTGNSTDQTVYTYSMPGASLASGKCLDIYFSAKQLSGATVSTLKVFFGATSVASPGLSDAANGQTFTFSVKVCNNASSTTAQWAVSTNIEGIGSAAPPNTFNAVTVSSPAENTGSTVVIKGTFNVVNTVTLAGEGWLVITEP